MSNIITVINPAGVGVQVDLDLVELSFTWATNLVQTISFTFDSVTYTQTFTYSGTNVATISPFLHS